MLLQWTHIHSIRINNLDENALFLRLSTIFKKKRERKNSFLTVFTPIKNPIRNFPSWKDQSAETEVTSHNEGIYIRSQWGWRLPWPPIHIDLNDLFIYFFSSKFKNGTSWKLDLISGDENAHDNFILTSDTFPLTCLTIRYALPLRLLLLLPKCWFKFSHEMA